ncbi:hypothetical protein [Cloacibacillus porcorum]|uniref:Uncharacterized protein n=1 Tax=Cloacibacillus porcorum TaxID=1197717 RepID=A0A1B2I674_9BACT|nr:hypothetical protein [Cloacibacillus porcorum]ANZ45453.1 hypothetical protein BED41_10470 [Cloacibacillus porcorum]
MREIEINSRKYFIEYGQNALCALEDQMKESIPEIMDSLSKEPEKRLSSFRFTRALFWAGLKSRRRNITLEEAGDILEQSGSEYMNVIKIAIEEISNCMVSIFPASETEEEGAEKEKNVTATSC